MNQSKTIECSWVGNSNSCLYHYSLQTYNLQTSGESEIRKWSQRHCHYTSSPVSKKDASKEHKKNQKCHIFTKKNNTK